MTAALTILAWLVCAAVSAAILGVLLQATGIGGPGIPPDGWDRPPADWVEAMRGKRQEVSDQRPQAGKG